MSHVDVEGMLRVADGVDGGVSKGALDGCRWCGNKIHSGARTVRSAR